MSTWQEAEAEFEAYWDRYRKQACVHKFTDTKEVKAKLLSQGITKKTGALTKKQPSDYLVTYKGETFYAEVKSTKDRGSFALSAMQPGQRQHARKVVAAGGRYDLFIRSEHLGQWYRVPFDHLIRLLAGTKSVKWAKLNPYIWNI